MGSHRKAKNSSPAPLPPQNETPVPSREVTPEPPSLPVLASAPTTFAERNHLIPGTRSTFLEHLATELAKDPKAAMHFHSADGILTVVTGTGDRIGREYFFKKQAHDGRLVQGKPARLLFIGQVGSLHDGTALGPFGASAEGGGLNRFRVRLVPIPDAPGSIERAELAQRAFLDNLIGNEEMSEGTVHKGWGTIVEGKTVKSTEFLFSHSKDASVPRDIITLLSEPIYCYPAKDKGTRVIKPLPVRRNRNTIGGNPTASTSTAVPNPDVEMTEAPAAKPPNSVYPRSAWPACEDVDTRFTGIKQLDIRDVDGSIIPPWQMAEKLKPGTLVRATATPICWIFVSDSYVDKKYALIIKSLQIIASVETEEEEHARSPAAIAKAAGKRKADDDDSDDEGGTFQSFGSSPAKKVRV
ncbi:hypothetical protein C8F01DRAFT_1157042 [Mycena amicta]|nr:hypothetical protein C8F01DRAFT_1157042 [Mycena amicta]